MSADTMSEAIALSSPSGRMSKRARAAALRRLQAMLDAERGPVTPAPPRYADNDPTLLRQRAADLRAMAARGMKRRAFTRQAAELDARAAALEGAE